MDLNVFRSLYFPSCDICERGFKMIFQVDMPDRTLFKNSNIQTIRNIVNNYCTDCWSLSDMRFCSSQKIFLLTFSGRNCSVGALKVVFPLNLL